MHAGDGFLVPFEPGSTGHDRGGDGVQKTW